MISEIRCSICQGTPNLVLGLAAVPPLQNRIFETFKEARTNPTTEVQYHWCSGCQHISVNKTVQVRFDGNYDNRQLFSSVSRSQFKNVVDDISSQVTDHEAQIIELGCGRGELLEMLRDHGYSNLSGFDPAAPFSNEIISNSYWYGSQTDSRVDLIIARHTLEEIPEPEPFVSLISRSLKLNGYVYLEITNATHLLNPTGFFSLYPECSNLYSSLSISKLLSRHNLTVERISQINDGEWLGVWARKLPTPLDFDAYLTINKIRDAICALPKPIGLWGAGGRGANILAFLGLGIEEVNFVVDINPSRHGKYLPPFGQEVISPASLSQWQPKSIVIANDKYTSEILPMIPVGVGVFSIQELTD